MPLTTTTVLQVKINGQWVDIPALKGDPGDDYILTAQDKEDIADIVLSELNDADSTSY